MDAKKVLHEKVETLSDEESAEVLNFITLLRSQFDQKNLECLVSDQRKVLDRFWGEDDGEGWVDL